ncbi:MAG: DUF1330 domain-containing protein [Phycisphaerae bacterium]|nr:DUF1330 domain-containing protein [Saprospiraceae bacterium]
MIYITQLIYLKPGQETTFDQFEAVAIPLISKYRGELLLRIRLPDGAEIIESKIETPYEMHLVSFESEADFGQFMRDEERQMFLHLKEQAIRATMLIKGEEL